MGIVEQVNDLKKYAAVMEMWDDSASKISAKAMKEAAATIEKLNVNINEIKVEILELAEEKSETEDKMISIRDLGGILYDVFRAHTRGKEGEE